MKIEHQDKIVFYSQALKYETSIQKDVEQKDVAYYLETEKDANLLKLSKLINFFFVLLVVSTL